MNVEKVSRKEKNQNIQVFVRLRPINNRERELKSLGVVEVSGNKEVIVKQSPLESKLSKKFTFDRAFGPNSKQVEVYHEVVSPLIEEVLAGYNCTVFAYGQTGTGKTHTMVGESTVDGEVPWQNDPMAGIIPRALSQLFDELRITNSEYTVRVSYLELYNEELFDLLSSTEDNSKLRIYEDVTRKGSNIVNGLEEVTVYNKNEVYKIMAKGQEKRRIASTLMNAQSSRSHTVFTIVVHMKENSSEGEELMKIGKLNLVDLAGSENISKAGSDNPARKERARECVNINQSLLTLGRVITSLVERHPHIPYRESKLTRLLQESLGGRTKTSIIATISPGHRDVEETLSTLEYANRARCIQNKPEVNQRITKHAVLKEYSEEIDRLKRDLLATREKNGVYISIDSYSDMNMKMEEQSKEIQEQILYIRALKEEKDRIEGLFNELADNLKRHQEQLEQTNAALSNTKSLLKDTKKELVQSITVSEEQKHLVTKQAETEAKLSEQAETLLSVADLSTADITHLQNTVDKKRALESTNLKKVKGFSERSQDHRSQMKTHLNIFTDSQLQDLQSLQRVIDSQNTEHLKNQHSSKQLLNDLYQRVGEMLLQSEVNREEATGQLSAHCEGCFSQLKDRAECSRDEGCERVVALVGLLGQLEEARERDRQAVQQMTQFVQQWNDAFVAKLVNLRRIQTEWWEQTVVRLQAVARQQQEESITQARNAALARKMHQEELKTIMKALEDKIMSGMTNVSREEEDRQCLLEKGGEALSGVLAERSAHLAGRDEGVGWAVGLLEDSNRSFIADIASMQGDHMARIDSAIRLDTQIKESVSELGVSWKESWVGNLTVADDVKRDVLEKQKEVISSQHLCHAEFLKRCQSEAPQTLAPVEATIEGLTHQTEINKTALHDLQTSADSFRKNMEHHLATNDTIENKFINEEYRLYSPTGKTPNRRDFSYPRELAATSPHDTIIRRFRNMYNGTLSPPSVQVINLDQTMEETPVKKALTADSAGDSSDSGTVSPPSLEESQQFVAPCGPAPRLSPPTLMIHKSTSEGDIYSLLNADSQSKENLNRSANDKKEFKSRLKQPNSQTKKVLGNRNY